MLDFAEATFSLGIDPLGEEALREQATRMFEEWDAELANLLPLPDYALYFELEEGSLKGKGRIGANALALLFALEHADGIASGLERMVRIGRKATNYLVEEARSLIPANHTVTMRSRRSSGDVGQLESLFIRVRNRELEPHEAAKEVMQLLGKEPDVTPEMIRRIQDDLLATPKIPKQLDLQLDDERVEIIQPTGDGPQRQRRRTPKPEPAIPTPLFRVEIVRDSKNGRRRIKVDPL